MMMTLFIVVSMKLVSFSPSQKPTQFLVILIIYTDATRNNSKNALDTGPIPYLQVNLIKLERRNKK